MKSIKNHDISLKFRPAIPSDLGVLHDISVQSKRHWNYPDDWIQRWLPDLLITEEAIENDFVMVVEDQDTIIGFCAVSESTDQYEIEDLWLLPSYIGKGLGKELLEATLARCQDQRKKIVLIADPNAEAFYRKQGFITYDHQESYPPGRLIPMMVKKS